MKMEPIVSSETSAIRTHTPGNYPKRNNLHLEHGESLRTTFYDVRTTTKSPNDTFSEPVAYPGILFGRGGGGLTNSVEDRGQRNGGLGAVAP